MLGRAVRRPRGAGVRRPRVDREERCGQPMQSSPSIAALSSRGCAQRVSPLQALHMSEPCLERFGGSRGWVPGRLVTAS